MKNIKYASYIAVIPSPKFSGITKKIINTVNTLNLLGYDSEKIIISKSGLKGIFLFLKSVLFCNTKKIIIRFPGAPRTILILPIIIIKRMQGIKVILDNPTPLHSIVYEIYKTEKFLIAIFHISILHLFFPFAFYPYNRILQYSVESKRFSFGIRSKIKLVGNGIDVKSLKLIKNWPNWISKELRLVMVASLQTWHGVDRLIDGLNIYYNNSINDAYFNITITIIGDGDIKSVLINKVEDFKLNDFFCFPGYLKGEELDKIFENAHIGISALGSYRKKLYSSSTLKVREYVARGLPFVLAEDDIDFPLGTSFVYRVPNDPTPINFFELIEWYDKFRNETFKPNNIRDFAFEKLDFKNKVYEMFIN